MRVRDCNRVYICVCMHMYVCLYLKLTQLFEKKTTKKKQIDINFSGKQPWGLRSAASYTTKESDVCGASWNITGAFFQISEHTRNFWGHLIYRTTHKKMQIISKCTLFFISTMHAAHTISAQVKYYISFGFQTLWT